MAVALLWARHLLSQMDVPTRQAFVMAVVDDHEREAAAVTTTLWRTVAQSISPALTGWIMQGLALSAPFAAAPGMRLLVPDATRTQLRVIALVGGRLVETGRCALGAPAIGPLRAVSPREVSMVTTAGTKVVAPTECAR